jgi:hypothetical protein
MKKIYTFLLALAFFGLSMSAMAQNIYGITGNMYGFLVTKNGDVFAPTYSTIGEAVAAIKTDAHGIDCTIQFGNSSSILNTTTNNITFDGGASGIEWGLITLTGRLQSTCKGDNGGTIRLINGACVESQADITNNAIDGNVFYHASSGTLTITGGNIMLTEDGVAIVSMGTGDINILGGKVEATAENGIALAVAFTSDAYIRVFGDAVITSKNKNLTTSGTICFVGTGAARLQISGGTVENTAGAGVAVSNHSSGQVVISGGTITSEGGGVGNFANGTVNITGGNISAVVAGVGNFGAGKIIIDGGTISSETFFAVGNAITGEIIINGGMILAKDGIAVNNLGTGTVTINGGIGFAYGSEVTDVISGAVVVPTTSKAVLVAWDKAAGNTIYEAGESVDLLNIPAGTAKWDKQGGKNGIAVKNDPTFGFIPIDGITINGVGVKPITNDELRITVFPNPTTGLLQVTSDKLQVTSVEEFDVMGKCHSSLVTCHSSLVTIDISHLPAGVYFLKIDNNIVKVVKQ